MDFLLAGVAVLSLIWGIRSYIITKETKIQDRDSDILSRIETAYKEIPSLLTCPMTRGTWISLCYLLSEIEKMRNDLFLNESKESYKRMLGVYRVLYWDRIFCLPARAYLDGDYDRNDKRPHEVFSVFQEMWRRRLDVYPIVDEEMMYFLWQHFKFSRDYTENTAYSKKGNHLRKLKDVRELFEVGTELMDNTWSHPSDGKIRVINSGRANGYSAVYKNARQVIENGGKTLPIIVDDTPAP